MKYKRSLEKLNKQRESESQHIYSSDFSSVLNHQQSPIWSPRHSAAASRPNHPSASPTARARPCLDADHMLTLP